MASAGSVRRGVVGVGLVSAVVVAGCARAPDLDGRVEEIVAGMDLLARAAQLVVIAAPIYGAEAADSLLTEIASLGAGAGGGGIWVDAGSAAAIAQLAHAIRDRGGARILLGANLDEGVGGAIEGGTVFPPFARVVAVAERREVAEVAEAIAQEARALGLDLGMIRLPPTVGGLDFVGMPIADLPDRFAAGTDEFDRHGIRPILGVGWHPEPGARADWDLARLRSIELPIIEATRRTSAGFSPGEMSLPSLTGDTTPLLFSPTAVQGILRRDAGWQGLVVADLRGSAGESAEAVAEAAVRAVAAGSDLVVVRADASAVVNALLVAVEAGRLSPVRMEAAARRVLRVKLGVAADQAPLVSPQLVPRPLVSERASALSDGIADRLVFALSGRRPSPAGADSILLLIPVGRGDAFALELSRWARARSLAIDPMTDPEAIADLLVRETAHHPAIVVLDFRDPGRASLADHVQAIPDTLLARSAIRVAFRRNAEPGLLVDPPDLLGWGYSPSIQRAAARLLVAGEGGTSNENATALASGRVLRPVVAAEVGMTEAGLAAADAVIGRAIQRGTFTSAALAVGRRGGLVRLRGFGNIAPEAEPVDPASTLFDIASLTKVVGTTTAVALLVDAGIVDLDAPVQRYVPEFRGGDKGRVTIRHLLAHSSGLPPGLPLYGSAPTRADALDLVIRQALRRPPGETTEYSDLGMILLAEAIERITDEPLDRFLATRLFVPLEMASTMYLPPIAHHDRTVPTALRSERPFPIRGVVHDGNAFRLDGVTGHAGLFSTASDLATFAQMMLNGGIYGAARILADSTVRNFTRLQPDADTRALGWDTPADRSSAGVFFSPRAYGHTGYTGTSMWIDPDLDLFVVLLTNRTFTEASTAAILEVRRAVHDAIASAIEDRPVTRRPGAR